MYFITFVIMLLFGIMYFYGADLQIVIHKQGVNPVNIPIAQNYFVVGIIIVYFLLTLLPRKWMERAASFIKERIK